MTMEELAPICSDHGLELDFGLIGFGRNHLKSTVLMGLRVSIYKVIIRITTELP